MVRSTLPAQKNMNRRDALRLCAGITTLPPFTPELLAIGRALRARYQAAAFRALDARQQALVATIAELIVPTTDTPGARAAGVPQFIDLLLADWYDPPDRARFLQGLADVDRDSRTRFGRDFVSATAGQQAELLERLDAGVTAAREAHGDPQEHFFHQMKWLTLYGYYTSEIGVNRELREQTIPGRYDPCVATGIGLRGEP
jgi:hypothetical protein